MSTESENRLLRHSLYFRKFIMPDWIERNGRASLQFIELVRQEGVSLSMASKITTVGKPEDPTSRWQWVRKNRPEVLGHLYYTDSTPQKLPESISVRDVVFGERGFVFKVGTHEDEANPCAFTETMWTVTYVVPKDITTEFFCGNAQEHLRKVFKGGGLEVYSYYNDD